MLGRKSVARSLLAACMAFAGVFVLAGAGWALLAGSFLVLAAWRQEPDWRVPGGPGGRGAPALGGPGEGGPRGGPGGRGRGGRRAAPPPPAVAGPPCPGGAGARGGPPG